MQKIILIYENFKIFWVTENRLLTHHIEKSCTVLAIIWKEMCIFAAA